VITLLLQNLAAALILLFGALAYRTASYSAFSDVQRNMWQLTGIAFLITGVINGLHKFWATWAFVAGAGTRVYTNYLQWTPALNYSRTFLCWMFAILMFVLIRTRGESARRRWTLWTGALLLGAVVGGVIGIMEGSHYTSRHYSAVALYDTLLMLALFGALLSAYITHAMDRHLWISITIFAVLGGFNAIWLSALAWVNIPGAWSPRPWQTQLYSVLALFGMSALAYRRLLLARRGVRVPALLEPLEPQQRASLLRWDP
jgi:uncharacterized membrane protein YsdA (DUF1294 family)